MIQFISFIPRHICEGMPGEQDTALISITNPGQLATLQTGWGVVLRLQFNDAEYEEGTFLRFAARGIDFSPEAKGFPARVHSMAVRGFLADLEGMPNITKLVIHCQAGRRRSAAVAEFAAEVTGGAVDREVLERNQTLLNLLRNPEWCSERPKVKKRGWFAWLSR